jgi:hypothetical protein
MHPCTAATLVAASFVLAGCASTPAPGPSIPAALQPPAGEKLWQVLGARGVQVYECRAKKDDPAGATEWAFVAPEAELLDRSGAPAGKHYAGPHWEAPDGSRVKGSVKARADAPLAGAIPWLLLATESAGPAGRFAGITSIQRVNTIGGAAPGASCGAAELGRQSRVPYTADYRVFVKG